jgi:ribulose-5-phosphate 4-epimerase/fuculose-1-phosphate aldolase
METETGNILKELWLAARVLTGEGVMDGFGHVSARGPRRDGHYHMLCDNAAGPFDAARFVELDSESDPVAPGAPTPSMERFIHGEIYKARPDVAAIVHTHAPALIPFGLCATPLRPLYHMCGFLAQGAPVFDTARDAGTTDLLITSPQVGRLLAESLGERALVLMRGHGAAVVGSSIREAAFRAVYAALNARLQPIAQQLGDPTFLSMEEAAKADELHRSVLDRPWRFWVKQWCGNKQRERC